MRRTTGLTSLLALAALAFAPAFAEPAAKSAVQMGHIGVTHDSLPWTTVLSTRIKTSEQKELLMAVSMECGLFTQTEVRGKKGDRTTAKAHSRVVGRVLLDGRATYPPYVTFCDREQTLEARLGGVLEQCTFDVGVDPITGEGNASFNRDDCLFTDEEINLILNTMNATHYNFIAPNVGTAGPEGHSVTLQIAVTGETDGSVLDDVSGRDGDYGSASAWATVGYGSLAVEEIRLVRGDTGITP